jgi:hypothetical protein
MGIVPMLRQLLWPPPIGGQHAVHDKPVGIEIYGPAGIRAFVRRCALNKSLRRRLIYALKHHVYDTVSL